LNLQVDCRVGQYGTTLRSSSLDRFMSRAYGWSFRADFTVQVYGSTLLVMFTCLVYFSGFVSNFQLSLRLGFTNQVLQFE